MSYCPNKSTNDSVRDRDRQSRLNRTKSFGGVITTAKSKACLSATRPTLLVGRTFSDPTHQNATPRFGRRLDLQESFDSDGNILGVASLLV
jgi:hypothetical protein